MIEQVRENPYVPYDWRMNEAGMQGWDLAKGQALADANYIWREACRSAVTSASCMMSVGIHKQHINRLLEPFSWIEEVVTATEWKNFFALRTASDADPTIQVIAKMMMDAYEESAPQSVKPGGWHFPFVGKDELPDTLDTIQAVSAARCARTSYQLRNGKRSDVESDLSLFCKLVSSKHWSPLEHPAQALDKPERIGNFVGWKQLRKFYDGESGGDYRLVT